MKYFLSFLLSFSIFTCFSQNLDQANNPYRSPYVSYSGYKSMKKEGKMKIDSIGFFIKDKDTLINILGFDNKRGKQVLYEPKDSVFLKRYKSIVYNNIYGKTKDITKARMHYWKEEIKVYIDSTVPSKLGREMKKMFKLLDNQIDSLKITTVSRREKANCFIYFINKPTDIDWDKRIINQSDGSYMSWNGKQQIYNTSIKINSQMIFNENDQLMLLKKHFIWSLGYFYLQPNEDCKSFFSNCVSVDKILNDDDLAILKYHYSYGICKGTDLETFEENHKNAQKLLKENPNNKYFFTHL